MKTINLGTHSLLRDVLIVAGLALVCGVLAFPFFSASFAQRAVAEGHQHLQGAAYNRTAAIVAFERALRFDATNKDALFSLARLHGISGEYEKAASLIAAYKAQYPDEPRIYYIEGLTYGFQEDYAQAAAAFRTFTESGVSGWAGYLDLAWALFQSGDPAEARVVLNEALQKFEPNVWLLTSRGAVAIALGEDTAEIYLSAAQDMAAEMSVEQWRASYSFNDPESAKESIAELQEVIALNLRVAQGGTSIVGVASVLQSPFIGVGPEGFQKGIVVAACADATCTTTACTSAANACGNRGTGTYNSCTGVCSALVPSIPSNLGATCTVTNNCGAQVTGTINCNGVCSASLLCGSDDTSTGTNGFGGGNGSGGSGGFTNGGGINGGESYGPGNVTITASPSLIRPGDISSISWVGTDVESCSVSGTNGSTWEGALGTQSVELAEEATFTVLCEDFYGDTVGDSVKVRILPDWQET